MLELHEQGGIHEFENRSPAEERDRLCDNRDEGYQTECHYDFTTTLP